MWPAPSNCYPLSNELSLLKCRFLPTPFDILSESKSKMKFMLLTYLDEKTWNALNEDDRERVMASAGPHVQALLSSGKFLGGAPLYPTSTAKSVAVRNGKRLVTDGPFAETREQLGGYTLIDAKDLDEAVEIAAGFFGNTFPSIIEVRQIVELKGIPAH